MDTSPETPPARSPETTQSDHELNCAGNRRGLAAGSRATQRRGAAAARPAAGAGDEAPGGKQGLAQQLADMRWVYAHPASGDRTPGQRTCRRWLRTDLARFMRLKSRLEEKHAGDAEDEEYALRVRLDERHGNPAYDHDEMVSVLIGIEGTDQALELYLTLDEWDTLRQSARDAGLRMGDWIITGLRGAAQAVAAAAGPPAGADPAGGRTE
jgi:hypothetical protein